jgi:hypothetical protein
MPEQITCKGNQKAQGKRNGKNGKRPKDFEQRERILRWISP